MEKCADPSYIRLWFSNKKRVSQLASSLGNTSESEVMNWLIKLGLDTYEFHMNHFVTVPVGIDFTANRNGKKEEDC